MGPSLPSCWVLLLLLAGCVVRYGPEPRGTGDPLPPPVDFGEVDARLGDLLSSPVDVDQRDRLQAALTLSRRAKTDDPATQRDVLAYLRKIVAIEERSTPVSAPVLPPVPTVESFLPVGADRVTEEALDADPPGAPAPEDAVAAFTAAAAAGELAAAVAAAEACRELPCWEEIAPGWAPVRDAHVARERERAGEAYLAARNVGDLDARLAAFHGVRAQLADLASRFPDATDAEDVRRNVAMVQREIEAQLAAAVERGAPAPADP